MKIKKNSDLYLAIENVCEMLYNCEIELDTDPYKTTDEIVNAINAYLEES